MSSLSVKLPAPNMKSTNEEEDDDWETDPDFLNAVNEKESRWGAKTVDGSGHQESIRLDKLREEVLKSDQIGKERKLAQMPRASEGYGGKFGVQHDRVDQCAVGFEYQGKVETHASQRDYSLGFGGTFGVQTDRVDKSAVGWDSHETVEKHESQKDYKIGFGGQFGVQSDRKDKTAAGWDEKEQTSKHESQTDYKKGFGGQFGVQTDRKDKSALGWNEVEKVKPHESQTDYKKGFGGQFGIQSDHQDKSALGWDEREKLQTHESQTDYKKGFGGQFGVQSDRKDKTAHGWEEHEKVEKHESQTDYKKGFGGQFGVQSDRQDKSALEQTEGEEGTKTSAQTHKIGAQNQQKSAEGATKSLRSKFEKMATQGEQQNLDRVREERERRKREDEELRQRQADEERRRQQRLEEQWAKQSDDGVEKGEEQQQQQRVAQPPKQRPTIGVRLPFLLPEQQRDTRLDDENSAENESHSVADSAVEEPQPPPVKVLPTGADFALPQHKIATSAAPNFEEKKSLNLVTKEEEEENPIVRDSGEWADEPMNSTPPQKGEDQNKQQQCHQYELPPIADDGVPNVPTSAASALSALPQHIYSESDQNMPPPADPSPAVVAEPSVGECAAATPLGTSTGATAVALFEYERQDDDEIGFEVNDIITDIEQIDVGWWRGVCKGRYGLFPANYVQLTEQK